MHAAAGFGLVCYAAIAWGALRSSPWQQWARRHRRLDFFVALLIIAGFVRLCETAYAHRAADGYVGLGAGLALAALVWVLRARVGIRSGRVG